jgi:cytochrome d ubiquinol oxidase subunit II
MHLYAIPLILALVGLALYTILGGADFGAGIWELTAGRGPEAEEIRDHAHHSIGPVWEANHVWLIFVLTVLWTAYPVAFASTVSGLSLPLLIAAVGIVLRGTTYALRSGTFSRLETRRIDTAFAIASLLTPFALGAAVGAIAAGRIHVGNAAGDLLTNWLHPVSIVVGALAVAAAAYLAAVFLAADAVRIGDDALARRFRTRALIAGTIAGAIAVAGLIVIEADVPRLWSRLSGTPGLPALILSLAAGCGTLALVWARRYEAARVGAAIAVAATIAGWALAQNPIFLPGLTVARAAAPHDTLVLIVIAVLAGAIIVLPSLGFLFSLVLRGHFDPGREHDIVPTPLPTHGWARPQALGRVAGACLLVGVVLLVFTDAQAEHAVGVVALLAFVVVAFAALRPDELAAHAAAAGAPQLIVLGPPGDGEGTQASRLAERLGLVHIGSGERLEQLGPDEGFVLDGYPRTASEAQALHDLLADLGRLDRPTILVWIEGDNAPAVRAAVASWVDQTLTIDGNRPAAAIADELLDLTRDGS